MDNAQNYTRINPYKHIQDSWDFCTNKHWTPMLWRVAVYLRTNSCKSLPPTLQENRITPLNTTLFNLLLQLGTFSGRTTILNKSKMCTCSHTAILGSLTLPCMCCCHILTPSTEYRQECIVAERNVGWFTWKAEFRNTIGKHVTISQCCFKADSAEHWSYRNYSEQFSCFSWYISCGVSVFVVWVEFLRVD